MRYYYSKAEGYISIDDYVKQMKPGQQTIYYVSGSTRNTAMQNPFIEVLKENEVPVLILTNNVDEILFNQIQTYKKFAFKSIESSYEDISKDLGDKAKAQKSDMPSLPDDDVTSFSLWLKNEFSQHISKVTVSKRLSSVPAVVFSQVSSSMRVIMKML